MQDQVAKNMPEFVQDPDQLIQTDPLTGNLISSSSTPSKNPVKAAPEKEIEDKAAPSPTKSRSRRRVCFLISLLNGRYLRSLFRS